MLSTEPRRHFSAVQQDYTGDHQRHSTANIRYGMLPSAQPDRSFRSPLGLAVPALTDQEEQRIARQVEQLRGCAGDYTTLHKELLRKRLAWWEANNQHLALRWAAAAAGLHPGAAHLHGARSA